jgi:hypothetical protein
MSVFLLVEDDAAEFWVYVAVVQSWFGAFSDQFPHVGLMEEFEIISCIREIGSVIGVRFFLAIGRFWDPDRPLVWARESSREGRFC